MFKIKSKWQKRYEHLYSSIKYYYDDYKWMYSQISEDEKKKGSSESIVVLKESIYARVALLDTLMRFAEKELES